MAEQCVTVLCGTCKVPVTKLTCDGQGESVICPRCERTASITAALESAKAYTADAAQVSLNRSMKRAAKGSKMLSFRGSTQLTKSYDFITDLDLG